jgi:hypothetical protein
MPKLTLPLLLSAAAQQFRAADRGRARLVHDVDGLTRLLTMAVSNGYPHLSPPLKTESLESPHQTPRPPLHRAEPSRRAVTQKLHHLRRELERIHDVALAVGVVAGLDDANDEHLAPFAQMVVRGRGQGAPDTYLQSTPWVTGSPQWTQGARALSVAARSLW